MVGRGVSAGKGFKREEEHVEDVLAIVLAAGQGTRMKSDLPKVLCRAADRPMLDYVLDALLAAGVTRQVIVVGYRGDLVREAVATRPNTECVEQSERLGTGHAVRCCLEQIRRHRGPVVIVAGDSPMIQSSSLRELLAEFQRRRPACLLGTLHKENPKGLGRIVRDSSGQFVGIVEEKDASESQRAITEVNMSTYVFDSVALVDALSKLTNNNQQGEYYLTDCPGILLAAGQDVAALPVLKPCEALSVNTPEELLLVEAELRRMG
jgi:bifunctional UDP-N-acetylglucosamine pyrophosphorylase / glucosamine-1-phosphate N-acetyltransferase